MTVGPEGFQLSERQRRLVEEADLAYADALEVMRKSPPNTAPASDKFTGPVFVDKDGNVQGPADAEGAAEHAEYLRKTAYYEDLRRKAQGRPPE